MPSEPNTPVTPVTPDPNAKTPTNPAPDPKATPDPNAKPDTPPMFKIKVNGQERLVTQDELLKMAEKSGGAEEAFRRAAEAEKNAAQALHLQTLLQASRDASKTIDQRVDAMSEIAILQGEDPAIVAQQAAELKVQLAGGATPPSKGNKGNGAEPVPPKPLTLADQPAEVQEAVAAVREQKLAAHRQKIYEVTQNSVEADQIVATLNAEDKAYLVQQAKNEVQRRVVAEGEGFGPELVAAVIQGLRPLASKLLAASKPAPAPAGDDTLAALAQTYPELMGSLPMMAGTVKPDPNAPKFTRTDSGRTEMSVGGRRVVVDTESPDFNANFMEAVAFHKRVLDAKAKAGEGALNR